MLLFPEGLWWLLGKVWMGNHGARSHDSHHSNRATTYPQRCTLAAWRHPQLPFSHLSTHSVTQPCRLILPLSLEPDLSSLSSGEEQQHQ